MVLLSTFVVINSESLDDMAEAKIAKDENTIKDFIPEKSTEGSTGTESEGAGEKDQEIGDDASQ